VVCSAAICSGTLSSSPRFWRNSTSGAVRVVDDFQRRGLLSDATKLLWFESPINPTLRCVDIAAAASACRARGVISVIDNTFASPVNQQPTAFGVDVVMHSDEYLNGHSDVTAGALVGPAALIERLQPARKLFGGVLEPASAYALGRGLKTIHVRVARQNETAARVAAWLADDRRVTRVFYPGLASHPDHAIARAQMSGFGGMVTFEVADYAAACRMFDRLKVIQRAASLGGVESLCSLPLLTSQYGFTDEQLAAAGVTRGMARLSIGLEHPDDLIADLDSALQ
jgi:cystathionine beta-lyase/cystathionine gamma-synthase